MSENIESENAVGMTAENMQAERIRVLYKQVASVLVGNIFVASLLTIFIYTYTNNSLSLYWMAIVFGITVIRYGLLKQYYKVERDESSVIRWGWIFAGTAFVSGCTWGAASILFLQTDNLIIMVFLLMTLTGITVGSSASLANFVWSYYAFAIPTILPFAYVLVLAGEPGFIVLSLMLSVFLLLQLVVAKKNQNTLDKSIVLRNENIELVEQLQIKNKKAEQANVAKTRFLAAASHDLRQPLHAMSIFLNVLSENNKDPEQAVVVDKIKKSSVSLENLLESLLDISKLDAGVINVDVKPFKIQTMFDVLRNEFKSIAAEKELDIHFMPTSLSLNTDMQIIERVLRNLISNAIRYTEKGKVLVGCRRKKNSVVLSVWDTGIGIDSDESDIIFEEFHQLDNLSRDRSKGLGLGLSIVKRLTALLGVELSLKSVPGKGSVFSVECPRSFVEKTVPIDTTSVLIDSKLSDKTIIVVEDEAEIRDALNMLLSSWGCRVLELTSVGDVKDKLSVNDKVDMILADYRLANHETGVDVIHAIHELYHDEKIPAIIITGDTAPQRIKDAECSGFQIMHKPVAGGKLRALINSLLSK